MRAGFNAMLCARGTEPLQQAAREISALVAPGRKVAWKTCDVSDDSQVAGLAAQVDRELGGCDVLVNNAGRAGPGCPA